MESSTLKQFCFCFLVFDFFKLYALVFFERETQLNVAESIYQLNIQQSWW